MYNVFVSACKIISEMCEYNITISDRRQTRNGFVAAVCISLVAGHCTP